MVNEGCFCLHFSPRRQTQVCIGWISFAQFLFQFIAALTASSVMEAKPVYAGCATYTGGRYRYK